MIQSLILSVTELPAILLQPCCYTLLSFSISFSTSSCSQIALTFDDVSLWSFSGFVDGLLTPTFYFVRAAAMVVGIGTLLWLLTVNVVYKTKLFLSGERETDEALAALALSHLDVRSLRGHCQGIPSAHFELISLFWSSLLFFHFLCFSFTFFSIPH